MALLIYSSGGKVQGVGRTKFSIKTYGPDNCTEYRGCTIPPAGCVATYCCSCEHYHVACFCGSAYASCMSCSYCATFASCIYASSTGFWYYCNGVWCGNSPNLTTCARYACNGINATVRNCLGLDYCFCNGWFMGQII